MLVRDQLRPKLIMLIFLKFPGYALWHEQHCYKHLSLKCSIKVANACTEINLLDYSTLHHSECSIGKYQSYK